MDAAVPELEAAPLEAAPAQAELEAFLCETASPLSAGQATALALRAWIAAQRQAPGTPPAAGRGYQWKCLFLPEGTELRMEFARQDFHARVSGNAIYYEGMPVSPRQFSFPGQRAWLRAQVLRRRCEQQAQKQPLSPLDAMREAASCMSETLKNALALVERSTQQAVPLFERRLERPRRALDVLGETCMLD